MLRKRKVSCTVSRNGDLIHKTYLQVKLPELPAPGAGTNAWVENVGHMLIQEVYIEIGGQQIDKHYGDWLNVWNELTQTAEKESGYNVMIGNTADLTDPSNSAKDETTLYIPLQFWLNTDLKSNLHQTIRIV
ncbi:hypothetical protein EB118_20230 [bacterium]|nr:hypothetical protein [bacterium]NDD83662.1 hypothetical protein [bacterium]NDG32389.1 hypothetical protein [bacterium]